MKSIFKYKELLFNLALRNLKIRYARTMLGFLWVIIQPLLHLFIFIILFKQFLNIDTGNIPYPLFALIGVATWNFFSFQAAQGSAALIEFQHIITKIFFPKIIIHLSKTLEALVDFLIMLLIAFCLMLYYGISPSIYIISLPIFLFIGMYSALAISLFVSIITIRFRDFQFLLQYLLNLFLWITPVAYPSTIIPESWRWIYYLNPIAGVVDGVRWSILGGNTSLIQFIPSFMVTFILFIMSYIYFKKKEMQIVDYI